MSKLMPNVTGGNSEYSPGGQSFGSYYPGAGPSGSPWDTPQPVATGQIGARDYQKDYTQNYNQRKWAQRRFNDFGYSLDSRPYEFDANAYKDPNYQENRGMLQGFRDQYQGRESPEMAGYLKDMYMNTALGKGPSIAETSLNQSLDRNLANQLAMQASGTGGNRASAARGAAYNMGNLAMQSSNAGAMAKLQESFAARDALTGIEQSNLQAQMQTQQQNDAMVQQFISQGLSLDQAQWAAGMALEEQRAAQHQSAQATQAGIGSNKGPGFGERLGGALLSTAGALGAAAIGASDKRLKKRIKPAMSDAKDFMDKLKAYSYDYKDEKHGTGRQYGVMAQDMEKSKIGKTLVVNTPEGKGINTVKGYGAVLQALSNLNKRLSTFEVGGKKHGFA